MLKLSAQDIQELKITAEEDFYFFAKGILGFDWLTPHIHLPICRILEDEKNIRFLGELPRGWLKTTLVSEAYPAWRAIKNSSLRILLVQNTFTNAAAKLKVIKSFFEENQLVRILWPDLLPTSQSTWSKDSACLNRPKSFNESTFECAGSRTQVTSRHYDIIIEDDTVAPDLSDLNTQNLCPTKEDVEQAIGWHRLAPPLLVDPLKSQIIVIGTRWFQEDLISWIRENEPRYKIYSRACREKDGKPDEGGEITYPERFSEDVLDELKTSLGPYFFSCLYMNKPVRTGDMIFQPEWIDYYETEPVHLRLAIFTSTDLAGDPEKNKGKTDYQVIHTTAKDMNTGKIYILDYWRKKSSPGELVDALFDRVKRFRPLKVRLEGGGYQGSVEYWIKERMVKENFFFNLDIYTKGRTSKNMSIMGLQPLFSNHMILLRRCMFELVNELLSFPIGANDDLIDSLAMHLDMWGEVQVENTKERLRELFAQDPFCVEQAINELVQKSKLKNKGQGFCGDILQANSFTGVFA